MRSRTQYITIIQETARDIQEREIDDPVVLNVVSRLAQLLETHPELAGYREVFSALARAVGLWNYIKTILRKFRTNAMQSLPKQ